MSATTNKDPSVRASGQGKDITFWDKLDLVPGYLTVIGNALYAAMTGPFRGEQGNPKYLTHVTHTAVRTLMGRLNTRQLHYVTPTTEQAYEAYCKKAGVQPDTVELKEGGLGHWIGNKNAKNVLIYYHGGGFALACDTMYFHFWHDVLDRINNKNKRSKKPDDTTTLAVFFLSYTLTPYARYPTQLRQAVDCLAHILTFRRPSNIYIAGDSAGGNLVLAVISHIRHPHPQLEPLTLPSIGKLAGAIAIAPWIAFAPYTWPSNTLNAHLDIVVVPTATAWQEAYLDGTPSDNYTEAVHAPASWWEDAPVEAMCIVAGGDELLIDSIREWAGKYRSVNPDSTTVVIGARETHVAMMYYRILGDTEETEQGKGMESWLMARL